MDANVHILGEELMRDLALPQVLAMGQYQGGMPTGG